MVRDVQGIFVAIVCSIVHNYPCHGGDWHRSLSSVYGLYDLENDHLTAVQEYIRNERRRLDDIRSFVEKREAQNAKELAEAYTESSINAFKTILRVKNDWEMLVNKMMSTTAIEFNSEAVTDDDVVSVLRSLRRLQIIYEFEVNEMTNGEVGGYTFENFTAYDCCQMADVCFKDAEFHCAYHWYHEAFKKYKEDKNNKIQTEYESFLEKYIESTYLVGDIEKAKQLIRNYDQEQNWKFNNKRLSNLRYVLWNKNKVFKRNTANDLDKKFYSHTFRSLNRSENVERFKTACQSWAIASRLSCNYFHGGYEYLWIGPLCEETVSNIPRVKIYHNILNDNEMNRIKELAKPKLRRPSTDTNEDIALRKMTRFRWLDDPVFGVVAHRIHLMLSEPNVRIVDKFVVNNYGLGGHYMPHDRYIDPEHLINNENVTAIVIFHLDDVEAGGSTVIPDVHVHVPCTKGSAVVVYKSHITWIDGNRLFQDSQYGTCPIFYGDKWTLTGWLVNVKPSGTCGGNRR